MANLPTLFSFLLSISTPARSMRFGWTELKLWKTKERITGRTLVTLKSSDKYVKMKAVPASVIHQIQKTPQKARNVD